MKNTSQEISKEEKRSIIEMDITWALEAEDRIDAYDRGDITSVPASMVFEKIEKKYSK